MSYLLGAPFTTSRGAPAPITPPPPAPSPSPSPTMSVAPASTRVIGTSRPAARTSASAPTQLAVKAPTLTRLPPRESEKAAAVSKKRGKAISDAKRAAAQMKSKGQGLEQAWKAVGGDHDVLAALLALRNGDGSLGDTYLFGFGAVTLTSADLAPIAKVVSTTLKSAGITSTSAPSIPASVAAMAIANQSLGPRSTSLTKIAAGSKGTMPDPRGAIREPVVATEEAGGSGKVLVAGAALLGGVVLILLLARKKKG